MRRRRLFALVAPTVLAGPYSAAPVNAGAGTGVGNVPQGTQSDSAYANSVLANTVTNVFATTQQTS